jgi:hypothetical protein
VASQEEEDNMIRSGSRVATEPMRAVILVSQAVPLQVEADLQHAASCDWRTM